jgi:hypothetical protein
MDYRNCLVGVYHNFEVIESPHKNGASVQRERCRHCNKEVEYKFLPDGELVDSRQYFLDHINAFAQPIEDDPGMMAAFLTCNPNAAARMALDEKQTKASKEFQDEMTEMFHWSIKRALDNRGWTAKSSDGVDRSSKEK